MIAALALAFFLASAVWAGCLYHFAMAALPRAFEFLRERHKAQDQRQLMDRLGILEKSVEKLLEEQLNDALARRGRL